MNRTRRPLYNRNEFLKAWMANYSLLLLSIEFCWRRHVIELAWWNLLNPPEEADTDSGSEGTELPPSDPESTPDSQLSWWSCEIPCCVGEAADDDVSCVVEGVRVDKSVSFHHNVSFNDKPSRAGALYCAPSLNIQTFTNSSKVGHVQAIARARRPRSLCRLA